MSTHALAAGLPVLPPIGPVRIDPGHELHPFSVNRFDAGPVRLALIVHAFDYRIAVLRDGAKPATWTTRSWKSEHGFLDDVSLPWCQQVAVMFQILCALVLDVLAAAECLTNFHGVLPDVLLAFEPWGHVDDAGVECGCRSSDRTGAYVHALAFDHANSTCAPTALLSQQTRQIPGCVTGREFNRYTRPGFV